MSNPLEAPPSADAPLQSDLITQVLEIARVALMVS